MNKTPKEIFVILPYKEKLDPNFAGAVSLYVKDAYKYSRFKNKIQIISSDNYVSKNKLYKNKSYITDFCIKNKSLNIKIVEIHNRPEYVDYIKKFFPNTKIILTLHNDPLELRGSINYEERKKLIDQCHKIIFISQWIQQRFYKSFKNFDLSKNLIIPHGVVKKRGIILSNKKKNILFVGKLNHSKGYHIFIDVASKFKKINPNWNFIAVGNEARKKIFPDERIVKEIGYKTNTEVLKLYEKAEIAVGNSVWDEPLGRIAIEASSRKCLPIISNKAGLTESKNIGIVLKKNTSTEIIQLLNKITKNKTFLRNKQNLFYKNNNFDLKKITKIIDNTRSEIIEQINIDYLKNKNKILHIANFNENSDGRLYYSFANKLNNGFIMGGNNVQTISNRLFLKNNRSFFKPFSSSNDFNTKVLNTIKNFSPNIIVIGHIFNLNNDVISYCKTNNIKICSWFIDSISPEFLKNETRKKFLNNLKFVDYCFLTSSPKIFSKNKYFNKLRYIPNPVDKSIDSFKNFNNKNALFDVFVAISHGQNRAVLKKGKKDIRENFINNLIYELPHIKFAQFGLNNFEPIWGANYYHYLSKSNMALNISRGKYQNQYSSDRISSLIGNGLLVFVDKKTKLDKIFTNNDVVYYKNNKDLIKKIEYYKSNHLKRIKIAKSGYTKYQKYMNNIVISNYILSCNNMKKTCKPFWSF